MASTARFTCATAVQLPSSVSLCSNFLFCLVAQQFDPRYSNSSRISTFHSPHPSIVDATTLTRKFAMRHHSRFYSWLLYRSVRSPSPATRTVSCPVPPNNLQNVSLRASCLQELYEGDIQCSTAQYSYDMYYKWLVWTPPTTHAPRLFWRPDSNESSAVSYCRCMALGCDATLLQILAALATTGPCFLLQHALQAAHHPPLTRP